MFKNYASAKTPVVNKSWIEMSTEKRVELVKNELKKDSKTIDFEITHTTDDGQIVFKVEKSIPANIRGLLLLGLEEQLKNNIDKGLTVWFDPVGDKSKLRNLRGIKVKEL
jgi:hypothetical protein